MTDTIQDRLRGADIFKPDDEDLMIEAAARIDALEAALRKYWNGSYFSGVSHEDADFINTALNDKTPTDTRPAGV